MANIQKVKTAVVGCGMISDIYLQNMQQKFSILDLVACASRTIRKPGKRLKKYNIRAMRFSEI